MLRILLLFFTCFISSSLFAGELKDDEALAIIKIENRAYSNVSKLQFINVETGKKVYFKCVQKDTTRMRPEAAKNRFLKCKPKRIKSGLYYLASVRFHSGYSPIVSERPKNDKNLLSIKAKSVNYLGDWLFTEIRLGVVKPDFQVKVDYLIETLSAYIERYPDLKNYPIYMIESDGKVSRIKWQK